MSNYDKVVKSATKPKIAAPKPKYVDVLITASFSEDSSLNEIVRSLATRLREPNTIVVFKSLVVLHTLIRHGAVDPVLSHLVSNASLLRLKHIASIDSSSGYSPPRSLAVYAQYLDTRVRAYRELRRDAVRATDTRGGSGGGSSSAMSGGQRLRRLKVEKGLLREVSITQKVMTSVLACSFFLDDPSDEITLAAFRMALKDLLDLYAAANEGIINMLEHYFEMSKVDAKDALKIYREFCAQTEKVVAYMTAARKYSHALRVAIPQLKHAPVSLAGALEEYLNDPNFEENRIEYRKNRQIADGESTSASKPADSSSKAKDKSKEETKREDGTKKSETPAAKPPIPSNNQALQDFFASIDTDQHTMMFPGSPQHPAAQQAMFTGAPAMFASPAMGSMGMQPTGMMAPNGMLLAPQMTGFNPFLQPNMTGFAPQANHAFLQAQMTGLNAFGQPGGGGVGGGGMAGMGMLQPQATGSNPFRPQSVFMPSSAAGVGMASDLTGFGAGAGGGAFGAGGATNGNALGGAGMGTIGGGGAGTSSLNRLQPISESGASTPTGLTPSQPNASTSTSASTSTAAFGSTSASAPPKPLMPQKTGSRNPFAPPPGETPPAPPAQPSKPAGPSLFELAAGLGSSSSSTSSSAQQNGGADASSATATNAQPKLVPQKTGLIGNIASEFAFGNGVGASRAMSPASGSAPTANGGGNGTGTGGANALSTGLGSLSLGGSSSAGGTGTGLSALAPQPTGFGGSSIKPFQPTSSFGQTLSAQVTGLPSTMATSGLGSGLGSTSLFGGGAGGGAGVGVGGTTVAGSVVPNLTGNPFARSLSPGASGAGAGTGLGSANGLGSSLFGTSTSSSTTTTTPSTLANGGATSPSLGSSLFRSGTVNAGSNANGLLGAGTSTTNNHNNHNPFPLAAQPTGAFLSSFTSGLSSVGSGSGAAGTLQAQPTGAGFGGSAIKPFQPTSAFGTAAFGGLVQSQSQQQQQQGQQGQGQQGQQASLF